VPEARRVTVLADDPQGAILARGDRRPVAGELGNLELDCGAVNAMVRRETLHELVELVREPTCLVEPSEHCRSWNRRQVHVMEKVGIGERGPQSKPLRCERIR